MRCLSSPTVDFGKTRKARSEGKLSAGDKTLISRAEGSMISGAVELSVTTVGWLTEEEEKDEDEEDVSSPERGREEDIGECEEEEQEGICN